MKTKPPKNIGKIFAEGTLIDEAMKKAVLDALRQHKRAGNPVAEWRNGRVVWVAPEDIVVDGETAQKRARRTGKRGKRSKN